MQIHRISLENTEFEGNNYTYLVGDADPVLIDPGVATNTTREQLAAGLAGHNVTFEDLHRFFLLIGMPTMLVLPGNCRR